MTLYETIFVRRSVRQYENTELPDSELRALREFIRGTNQMTGTTAHFDVVGREAVNGVAPHYVLAYCGNSDAECANVGFVLSNIDLYLQSRDFGSLFLGVKTPIKPDPEFCIMLAFGRTAEPLRLGEEAFDRLPIGEISNLDTPVARAVRLAPSAVNSQPWKLEFSQGSVAISYFGRGLKKLILKRLNKIDVGIAARHAELALLNDGKTVESITPKASGKDFKVIIDYRA